MAWPARASSSSIALASSGENSTEIGLSDVPVGALMSVESDPIRVEFDIFNPLKLISSAI